MRLLNVNTLQLVEFRNDKRPKYAIASHRWVEGCEVTFQNVQNRYDTHKSGYKKIVDFARYIQKYVPLVEWLWIDTCCINKESAAELSESINLMFDWYRDAEICIAYLEDVEDVEAANDNSCFEQSEWFRRGWTLQELLAPCLVVFVTKAWQVIGNKGACRYGGFGTCTGTRTGPGLEGDIARITGIPEHVLYEYKTSRNLSVEEKLGWIEGRSTTREEDMSYALYGIFEVTPGANYGEKREGARQRLLAAIRYQDDLALQQAEQFRKIVDWLSPPDPWTNHHLARQLHEPQTGTWFTCSDQYQNWKAASTGHLWMPGKAGCGKTVLCSVVVEDIKAYCGRQPHAGYAVFYFSFSDKQKQRLADLLRSLIVQLGWKGIALSMLRRAYDKPDRSLLGLDELENILVACFQSYDKVFLLVDALDECPEEDNIRHNMTECLARLSQKARHVKIFATSRELLDIRASMVTLKAEQIAIATRAIDKDIQQYVATQLLRNYRLSRLEPATKALIEETISVKSDGMFRWAYCQLQELQKLKSTRPKFVKNALYALPTTLDETYERMLISIEHELRPDAFTLLRWLAYAKSPPSLGELVDATVINLATDDGNVEVEDRPGADDTLEILSGLVTILRVGDDGDDSQAIEDMSPGWPASEDNKIDLVSRRQQINKDTKVRLAHFSVKEYLESKRILRSSAKEFYLEREREHRFLTQSCLVYLMHYSNSDEKASIAEDLTTFPLLRYAADSWFYHAGLQQAGDVTREIRLLRDAHALHDWQVVCQHDRPWQQLFERHENEAAGLYYASFFGLPVVVSGLLAAGVDVNAQSGGRNNALYAASSEGHEKVVQILIDAKADVNAQGGYYGNALYVASLRGHEKVVQVLVDAKADVNAPAPDYSNALYAASSRGDEKVVRILVDAKANVNARGGTYSNSNALYAASSEGYEKVVQILVDAKADVNAPGGNYGNALYAATLRGHEKVVQILVDAKADGNAPGGFYSNAVYAAALKGDEKVVQILVDAKADGNAPGGFYSNALYAASSRGYEKVVQILVDAGADVNVQEGDYRNRNALYMASSEGHEKVVRILVDAKADVNAQGGYYGNALQVASSGGHEKVVQILVDAKADVNAQGGYYGNALYAASSRGHEKVVRILVDAKADVNAQGGRYSNRSALHVASSRGYEKVVQVLIDAGANALTDYVADVE